VLLLVGASGCGGDSSAASAGDVVQGRDGDVDGARSYAVLVPTGELTVQVSKPVDVLSARQAADGTTHEAPAGTGWVGVDWTFAPGADYDPLLRTLMDAPMVPTTVRLESAGTSTELGVAPGATGTPADTRTSGVVWVAVEQDAVPVVQVEFDGVIFSVDTASGEVTGEQAAALEDLTAPQAPECRLAPLGPGAAEGTCVVTLAQVPYLAGRGWARLGWSVVRVETRVDTFRRDGSAYTVQEVQDGSVVDGRAMDQDGATRRRGSLVTQVVTGGSPQVLNVDRTLSGVLADGGGPDEASVVVGAVVDLDE
jgi:hypothetical protein